MTEPYRLHEPLPDLVAPVLVGMLSGWIDASAAAASAMATVEHACDVRPLATFDGDQFTDYRARRPTMELRDGVNTRLVWPEIVLKVGRDPIGNDVLVLTGPEPDSAWHRFGNAMASLAVQLDVRMLVMLGAYPFATPHTRAVRLSTSSPSAELVDSIDALRNSVDVPAGMGAALEHALHDRGIPSLGLWAQVPHYAGTMSYPAASVALLEGLGQVTGLSIDATLSRNEATIQRQRIDQLIGGNDEHREMVRQMEKAYDEQTEAGQADGVNDDARVPTGDELAAEFERFLRDQDDDDPT